jgi:hypothetical protein
MEWRRVLHELKHKKRFFSSAARKLFDELFDDVDALEYLPGNAKQAERVAYDLPKGTVLFRARVCRSISEFGRMYRNPYEEVGPPPSDLARAGRMNAEGVRVCYGAMDPHTCIAELRPALRGEATVISLRTTQSIRLLDFTRLTNRGAKKRRSYFQPNLTEQAAKQAFLEKLHAEISQPVVPGRESDYLITQTMAEYLNHVHRNPFDGILFRSVQQKDGVNIVLFPIRSYEEIGLAELFPLDYVEGSIKLFSIESIDYKNKEKQVFLTDDGTPLDFDPRDEFGTGWPVS